MKPRLLDLFCGAGGSAKGYQRSGFEVVGIDVAPQPNYCGDYLREHESALAFLEWLLAGRTVEIGGHHWGLEDFVGIHASPPCQHAANVTRWRGDQDDHPDLIGPTRELLERRGSLT